MVKKLTLFLILAFSSVFGGVESDFFRACLNGDQAKVIELYEQVGKKLIYARDKDDNTCLHLACCSKKGGNKESLIAFLLSKEANVNATNRFKSTPLTIAICNTNYEAVELLVKRPDLNPNIQDLSSYSPLHYAVINRSPPLIKLLLSHPKINPNFGTESGASPLHFAAMYGYVEEAKALIECPLTDINVAQHDPHYGGATPLHFAAMQAQSEIVKMLIARGDAHVNASLFQGIHAGFTPLHFAVMNPDTVHVFDTVKILLAAGANPKKKCEVGKTPLELTEVSIIKKLLKNPETLFKN